MSDIDEPRRATGASILAVAEPADPSPVKATQGPISGQVAIGMQLTDANIEAVRRLSDEHITAWIDNEHHHRLRQLDLSEKEIDIERDERVRAHERDDRDRREREAGEKRRERLFFSILVPIVVLLVVLVIKGEHTVAKEWFVEAIKLGTAFVGGIGYAKLRASSADKKKKPEP